ncbi:MAG: gluconate 2-dehydrogenase subunit 3 family protein [Chloroflexota bacterium]|nr:gluconate 2-dehydrogenase subunit 3 family protein [Chloroflexota bacterium]
MTSQADGYRVLTAAQQATLMAIQNELVPPDGELPGAGAAGGAAAVDGYLHARPPLQTNVLTVLAAVDVSALTHAAGPSDNSSPTSPFAALPAAARVSILRAVESEHPEPFRTLVELTYTAYYTNPAIQALLGPDAQPPQPHGYPPPPPFDPRRLERVKQRGQLWLDA